MSLFDDGKWRMGVPLAPLAAAYGLGLGHLAGQAWYRRQWPATGSQLETYNHVRGSNTRSPAPYINPSGAQTSTALTMKRARSYTRSRKGKKRGIRRRLRRVSLQWPRFRLVKFKVVTQMAAQSTGGTGAISQYLVSANGLADPHGSAGGNLPLGLDQWAAMYKKYVVVASNHYVKVHNLSSTGAVCFGMTLRQPNESAVPASAEAALELPMTVSKILSPDLDHAGLGCTYKAKKYWHVRKFMDHENLHGALTTTPTDPTNKAYVSVWFEDVNRTQEFTLEGYLTSEYTCLLFDPITPSRSAL